jgi:hypothetical protein
MHPFEVDLTRDGLAGVFGDDAETVVPESVLQLMAVWHVPLRCIDPDFTFGDLVAMLRGAEGVTVLSPLLGCDLAALFADAAREPVADDACPVHWLEVFNAVGMTEYEPDPERPDLPPRMMDDREAAEHDDAAAALDELLGGTSVRTVDLAEPDSATGHARASRVHPGEEFGTWHGPYHVTRVLRGVGRWAAPPAMYGEVAEAVDGYYEAGFRVNLAPACQLLEFPLRYNAEIAFPDGRPDGDLLLHDRFGITFGEFLHAIFSELGSLGTPQERDSVRREYERRLNDGNFAEGEGGDEPWR